MSQGLERNQNEQQEQQQPPEQKRRGKLHTISERVSSVHANRGIILKWDFPLSRPPFLLFISEQRRRERIRGKFQALQELMPNCDKVSFFSSFFLIINQSLTLYFFWCKVFRNSGHGRQKYQNLSFKDDYMSRI